jgi:hypothetical protein
MEKAPVIRLVLFPLNQQLVPPSHSSRDDTAGICTNKKGAVTKWLIILLQPLFCVFISSFLALL